MFVCLSFFAKELHSLHDPRYCWNTLLKLSPSLEHTVTQQWEPTSLFLQVLITVVTKAIFEELFTTMRNSCLLTTVTSDNIVTIIFRLRVALSPSYQRSKLLTCVMAWELIQRRWWLGTEMVAFDHLTWLKALKGFYWIRGLVQDLKVVPVWKF